MMRIFIVIVSAFLSFTLVGITHAESLGSKLEQQLLKKQNNSNTNSNISQTEAASGIKEAMAQGVKRAITQLGREDGFNSDPVVRILVP